MLYLLVTGVFMRYHAKRANHFVMRVSEQMVAIEKSPFGASLSAINLENQAFTNYVPGKVPS